MSSLRKGPYPIYLVYYLKDPVNRPVPIPYKAANIYLLNDWENYVRPCKDLLNEFVEK